MRERGSFFFEKSMIEVGSAFWQVFITSCTKGAGRLSKVEMARVIKTNAHEEGQVWRVARQLYVRLLRHLQVSLRK